MPIIHDYQKWEFTPQTYPNLPIVNKKVSGSGFGSLFSSIGNMINSNKDTIQNVGEVAKTLGAMGSAASQITQAVKSAKELKEIDIIRKNREKREKEKENEKSKASEKVVDDILKKAMLKPGDGFYKFSTKI